MEVTWTVTKKSAETFDVVAKTLEKAQQKLAGRGDFGEFRPMPISATLKPDGTVSLTLGYRILMPVWKDYPKAPPQCQKEWDRMWHQLEKHEQEHLGFYLSETTRLFEHIKSSPAGRLTQKDLDNLVVKTAAEINRRSEEFDERTSHGVKEGVSLDPPFGCREMDL
jgi:hypothetical protein